MLMRFDPFRELDRLTSTAHSAMPMDAYRRGEEFVVHLDLPGVDPASIDLTVERNVLTVEAERRWHPEDGDQVVASERPHGSFRRQLLLGDALDAERIEARYEDGVLTLTVPMSERARPRRVEIRASGGQRVLETTSAN